MAIRFFRHLRDLFDVNADTIGDGETIVWDDTTEKFIPGPVGGLAAHIADPTDAHDASAVSFAPAGTVAATDVQAAIEEVAAEVSGGGAPTTSDYLVGTAQAGLSAEIVVGATPGGELGGTWASPTVDATHSGSTHAAVQAAAEATAAAALSAHLSDASDAHDASAVSVDSTTLAGTGTDVQAVLEELDDAIAGAGAPTTADYLVGTAQGGLSAEIVVGASPGGELGGTWASPTVDATHSGSSHAAVQAAAEATAAAALSAHLSDATDAHDASAVSSVAAGNLAATDVQAALDELDTEKAAVAHAHAGEDITSGTVADARIAATIARDSEVTAAVSAHEADTTSVHGVADTATLYRAGGTDVAVADGGTGASTAAGARANLDLEAGTDFPSQATFDDHSARHEDGGVDEISLAGLSGTSAALQTHLDDAADAHDASAISADSTTLVGTGTDVQAVLEELDNGIADHLADTSAAHAATAIAFTPDGSIAATTVQAAIVEVRDEAGGGGAPTTADYLVGTAQGGLSAEIVVGATPGGELGGTWASPTVDASHSGSTHAAVQAAAEATAQAALDAHTGDTADAHDASAISIADAGSDFTATDVEGALDELQADHEADATALSDHIADTSAAHAASAISADSTTLVGTGTTVQAVFEELDNAIVAAETATSNHLADASAAHAASAVSVDSTTLVGTGTDAQAVFEELDNGIADHLADSSAAHAASAISFSPTGTVAATDVQAAIAEVASEASGIAASLYDANTVLKADSDNTPVALTMGASTTLARLASGSIVAATAAEMRTLLDVPTNAAAVLDAIVDAKGDMILGTAADTVARLAAGANGTVPTYQSGQTTGILPQLPPGYELGYKEITSNGTSTATVQASATTVITMDAIVFDGSMCLFEFVGLTGSTIANQCIFNLWEDSTDASRIAMSFGSDAKSVSGARRYAPAAGSKVMTLRLYMSSASTGTLYGGAGTGGAIPPSFLRVTKV